MEVRKNSKRQKEHTSNATECDTGSEIRENIPQCDITPRDGGLLLTHCSGVNTDGRGFQKKSPRAPLDITTTNSKSLRFRKNCTNACSRILRCLNQDEQNIYCEVAPAAKHVNSCCVCIRKIAAAVELLVFTIPEAVISEAASQSPYIRARLESSSNEKSTKKGSAHSVNKIAHSAGAVDRAFGLPT